MTIAQVEFFNYFWCYGENLLNLHKIYDRYISYSSASAEVGYFTSQAQTYSEKKSYFPLQLDFVHSKML